MNNNVYTFIDRGVLSFHIGKVIKTLRNNQSINQAQLSIECNVSRNTISLIERGKISPTFDTIYRICTVIDISLTELLSLIEISLANHTHNE